MGWLKVTVTALGRGTWPTGPWWRTFTGSGGSGLGGRGSLSSPGTRGDGEAGSPAGSNSSGRDKVAPRGPQAAPNRIRGSNKETWFSERIWSLNTDRAHRFP